MDDNLQELASAQRAPRRDPRAVAYERSVLTGQPSRYARFGVSLFTLLIAIAIYDQFWVGPIRADLRETRSELLRTESAVRLLSLDAHRHSRF